MVIVKFSKKISQIASWSFAYWHRIEFYAVITDKFWWNFVNRSNFRQIFNTYIKKNRNFNIFLYIDQAKPCVDFSTKCIETEIWLDEMKIIYELLLCRNWFIRLLFKSPSSMAALDYKIVHKFVRIFYLSRSVSS